jgi:hypothetical protein
MNNLFRMAKWFESDGWKSMSSRRRLFQMQRMPRLGSRRNEGQWADGENVLNE